MKLPNLCITNLCVDNPPVTGGFPVYMQMDSYAEMYP